MLVKLERKHKQRLQVGYFVVNLFNRFHLNYGNLYWLAEAIDGFEDKTTAISTLRHPEKKLDSIIISIISRSFSRQYLRPFFPILEWLFNHISPVSPWLLSISTERQQNLTQWLFYIYFKVVFSAVSQHFFQFWHDSSIISSPVSPWLPCSLRGPSRPRCLGLKFAVITTFLALLPLFSLLVTRLERQNQVTK